MANARNTRDSTITTVEPVFIKDADMPSSNVAHIEIVRAVTRCISNQGIEGVQRIGRLWRIYLNSIPVRLQLLTKKSIVISGKMVALYEQNPFSTNQKSPEDKKDKLTIKGLPKSVSNDEVKNFLVSKDIVMSSDVRWSFMRDENGSLTSYINGDRFVYCEPFDVPIPRSQKICSFPCTVLHHGKDSMHCKSCNTAGHKTGDMTCKALAAKDSILAFRGYQHPLSNHYPTPIDAFDFDFEQAFKSVEHAFCWKMASEMNQHDLAAKIKNATHAGVVKQLCKELNEEDVNTWENDNLQIMNDLLREKAKSCAEFRECLLENKDKMLAESAYSKKWGSGLNKWVTEATKPDFWPGNNVLGMMLMEVTSELLMSPVEVQVDVLDAECHSTITNISEENIAETSEQDSDIGEVEVEDGGKEEGEEHVIETKKDNQNTWTKNTKGKKGKGKRMDTKQNSKASNGKGKEKQNKEDKAEEINAMTTQRINDKTVSTPSNSRPMDIRSYMDPKTGKRKAQETTPEKQEHAKKQVTG
jgi:ribA/ribD-fused uncharacterized protein